MNLLERVLSVFVAVTLVGCVDGDGPTGLGAPRSVTLAAVPRFSTEPSAALVAAIDRARVALVDTESDSILAIIERAIDPASDEWAFELTLELHENQAFDVRLDVELIDGDPIVEIVEFAGRTAFPVQASFEPQVIREINLGRGPLANLALTSLTVSGARNQIQEGGSDALGVDTVGASSGQIIFFESTRPEVASVDSIGNIAALSPGNTLIIARAGRVADTLDLTVGEVNLPSNEQLRRAFAPQSDYVTSDFFLGTLTDRMAALQLGEAMSVLLSDMLASRGFEAVGRFEAAQDLWETYGTGSDARFLDGPQLGVVGITLMHAADALGIDFLRN